MCKVAHYAGLRICAGSHTFVVAAQEPALEVRAAVLTAFTLVVIYLAYTLLVSVLSAATAQLLGIA